MNFNPNLISLYIIIYNPGTLKLVEREKIKRKMNIIDRPDIANNAHAATLIGAGITSFS